MFCVLIGSPETANIAAEYHGYRQADVYEVANLPSDVPANGTATFDVTLNWSFNAAFLNGGQPTALRTIMFTRALPPAARARFRWSRGYPARRGLCRD